MCVNNTRSKKFVKKMFNDVLRIHCTADTNQKDRPFLPFTGRDSTGKIISTICAFFPDEINDLSIDNQIQLLLVALSLSTLV